jgi:hypothetical protein
VAGCFGGVVGTWLPLWPDGYMGALGHGLVGKVFTYVMVRWGWLLWVDIW